MAVGPGVYDEVCTMVREATEAQAVVVMVIGGKHGSGFSIQGTAYALSQVPDALDMIAPQVRRDFFRGDG